MNGNVRKRYIESLSKHLPAVECLLAGERDMHQLFFMSNQNACAGKK